MAKMNGMAAPQMGGMQGGAAFGGNMASPSVMAPAVANTVQQPDINPGTRVPDPPDVRMPPPQVPPPPDVRMPPPLGPEQPRGPGGPLGPGTSRPVAPGNLGYMRPDANFSGWSGGLPYLNGQVQQFDPRKYPQLNPTPTGGTQAGLASAPMGMNQSQAAILRQLGIL